MVMLKGHITFVYTVYVQKAVIIVHTNMLSLLTQSSAKLLSDLHKAVLTCHGNLIMNSNHMQSRDFRKGIAEFWVIGSSTGGFECRDKAVVEMEAAEQPGSSLRMGTAGKGNESASAMGNLAYDNKWLGE